jgi:hypothetical protein
MISLPVPLAVGEQKDFAEFGCMPIPANRRRDLMKARGGPDDL